MRFYLDEMFSPVIAVTLRAQSCDTVSALELGHQSTPDADHLSYAARQQRAVVTRNHRHFVPLTLRFLEEGLSHKGVILVPRALPNEDFGGLVAALLKFEHEHPSGLEPYTVVWLTPS
jgi:hypothetical protein